jgi:hypothetical protein
LGIADPDLSVTTPEIEPRFCASKNPELKTQGRTAMRKCLADVCSI